MKKIIFSFLLSLFVVAIVTAQPPQRSMGPRGKGPRPSRENVEALKVAFMTKHLNLNVDEAQKFWPAYNACTEELKKARQEKKEDVLAFEENGETVFTKAPIRVTNPGGVEAQGGFEKTLDLFFDKYFSQAFLRTSGIARYLENPQVYKKDLPAGKNLGRSKGIATGYRWIANAGVGA